MTLLSSRVPNGKHLLKFLLLSVPYKIKGYTVTDYSSVIPSLEWDQVKEQCGDHIIDMIAEKYIHNFKKIILKRAVYSPIDFEKKPTTSIYGTLSCGAVVPYQILSRRPIPELRCYRTPIHNIYMCGAGSHPGPGVSMAPDRNAAQVIFADLNLDFKNLTDPG